MSPKVSSICMKVIPVLCFLLFLQSAKAQYNWTELDQELQAKQQVLGNNLVCLIWKGDSLIYRKEMGGLKRLLERRQFASLEEEVNSFAARDIRANPGTDFWYGNVGLNIAGRVLEVISKKKFDLLIKT